MVKEDGKHPSHGEWAWLVTNAEPGVVRKGPWSFVSYGTIGAYPGFVNGDGSRWVPLGAVMEAAR